MGKNPPKTLKGPKAKIASIEKGGSLPGQMTDQQAIQDLWQRRKSL